MGNSQDKQSLRRSHSVPDTHALAPDAPVLQKEKSRSSQRLYQPNNKPGKQSTKQSTKGKKSKHQKEQPQPEFQLPPSEAAFLPAFPLRGDLEDSDFEVIEVIAKGAYGNVIKVQREDNKRFYATKILDKAQILQEGAVRQCKDEASIQSMAGQHPFIVKAYEYWQSRTNLFLVLDYVPHGDMFTLWTFHGAFPEDLVRLYIAEMAMVLDYLHTECVIYRDIKMENILFDAMGHIQLTDFGLAKWLQSGDNTRTVCGTLQYMAPEVLSVYPYGHPADWWSVGILMYTMLAGRYPVDGMDTHTRMAQKVFECDYLLPSDISDSAQDVINRILTKSPHKRLCDLYHIQDLHFFQDLIFSDLTDGKINPVDVVTPDFFPMTGASWAPYALSEEDNRHFDQFDDTNLDYNNGDYVSGRDERNDPYLPEHKSQDQYNNSYQQQQQQQHNHHHQQQQQQQQNQQNHLQGQHQSNQQLNNGHDRATITTPKSYPQPAVRPSKSTYNGAREQQPANAYKEYDTNGKIEPNSYAVNNYDDEPRRRDRYGSSSSYLDDGARGGSFEHMPSTSSISNQQNLREPDSYHQQQLHNQPSASYSLASAGQTRDYRRSESDERDSSQSYDQAGHRRGSKDSYLAVTVSQQQQQPSHSYDEQNSSQKYEDVDQQRRNGRDSYLASTASQHQHQHQQQPPHSPPSAQHPPPPSLPQNPPPATLTLTSPQSPIHSPSYTTPTPHRDSNVFKLMEPAPTITLAPKSGGSTLNNNNNNNNKSNKNNNFMKDTYSLHNQMGPRVVPPPLSATVVTSPTAKLPPSANNTNTSVFGFGQAQANIQLPTSPVVKSPPPPAVSTTTRLPPQQTVQHSNSNQFSGFLPQPTQQFHTSLASNSNQLQFQPPQPPPQSSKPKYFAPSSNQYQLQQQQQQQQPTPPSKPVMSSSSTSSNQFNTPPQPPPQSSKPSVHTKPSVAPKPVAPPKPEPTPKPTSVIAPVPAVRKSFNAKKHFQPQPPQQQGSDISSPHANIIKPTVNNNNYSNHVNPPPSNQAFESRGSNHVNPPPSNQAFESRGSNHVNPPPSNQAFESRGSNHVNPPPSNQAFESRGSNQVNPPPSNQAFESRGSNHVNPPPSNQAFESRGSNHVNPPPSNQAFESRGSNHVNPPPSNQAFESRGSNHVNPPPSNQAFESRGSNHVNPPPSNQAFESRGSNHVNPPPSNQAFESRGSNHVNPPPSNQAFESRGSNHVNPPPSNQAFESRGSNHVNPPPSNQAFESRGSNHVNPPPSNQAFESRGSNHVNPPPSNQAFESRGSNHVNPPPSNQAFESRGYPSKTSINVNVNHHNSGMANNSDNTDSSQLGAFASSARPVPVPRPRPRQTIQQIPATTGEELHQAQQLRTAASESRSPDEDHDNFHWKLPTSAVPHFV